MKNSQEQKQPLIVEKGGRVLRRNCCVRAKGHYIEARRWPELGRNRDKRSEITGARP